MFPAGILLERSPDALHRTIDDKTVILHAGTGAYFTLNRIGSRIWELVEEGLPLAEIHTKLLAELDVTADVLDADMTAFVTELEREGLAKRTAK